MRAIFKEAILDSFRKVGAVLGVAELGWSMLLVVKPEYGDLLPIRIDNRVWYGVALVIIGIAFWRVLKVASNYKKQLESPDNIRIVYDDGRYPDCREIKSITETTREETIRVGYTTRATEGIEDPIVLPSTLFQITKPKYIKVKIKSSPLSPMVKATKIHYGRKPEYWVNVFRHIIGVPEIEICYENLPPYKIPISSSKYELTLIARGTGSENTVKTLTIIVSKSYDLKIIPAEDIPWR